MKYIFLLALIIGPLALANTGNQSITSFNKAKKHLEREVYFDNRVSLYCEAVFDEEKNITFPAGFTTTKYLKRAKKVEWEHVVPAENFGRSFVEWRDGHSSCVSNNGKSFKGRKCAEKMNNEYRFMQADLYNLYPAIGAVNALRSNYNFVPLPGEQSDFGTCEMKIENRKAEPPARARGAIARTYQYMQSAYPKYKISKQQIQLMDAWAKMYPVDEWECKRAKRIEKIQKNENVIVKKECMSANLW
jgi:deoxyribonuclease-1